MEILHVIRLMSELTGRNFLIDGNVCGKVTLIAPEPVSLEEAYQVFLSILEVQGFSVVPQGPVVKVIRAAGIRDSAIPTAAPGDGALPAGDAFVTHLVPLTFADVNQVRGLLSPLVSEAGSLLSYAPTNTLIVAETAANLARLKTILAALDVKAPANLFRVTPLEHADAEELAQVLTAQAPGIVQIQEGQAEGQAPQPAPGRAIPDLTISADTPTNSLVITADPQTYAIVADFIRQLDMRRAQVLVEGLIAEVSLSTARDLGVEWRLIDQPDGTQGFAAAAGSDATGVLNPLTADPTALLSTPGFLVGVLRNTLRLDVGGGEQSLLNVPLLLRAFEGNSHVEVLATPNLLTTDNEEAEIVVGEQRPFLTSVNRIPDAGIVNVSNTFDFRDVGITLRLTPQISKGNTVRTELFLEITRFVSEPEAGAVTTTKRSARTTVIVDDGQTIVLGGLIQGARNETETGVPLLAKVPLLGPVFRQSRVQRDKTNLLIFLTPHVIASDAGV